MPGRKEEPNARCSVGPDPVSGPARLRGRKESRQPGVQLALRRDVSALQEPIRLKERTKELQSGTQELQEELQRSVIIAGGKRRPPAPHRQAEPPAPP